MAAMRQRGFVNGRLMVHSRAIQWPRATREHGEWTSPPPASNEGFRTMYRLLVTALFALSLSFLTFAATFAEVPRSDFIPSAVE